MNLQQKIDRLKKISPRNLPRVVLSKLSRETRARYEKFLYSPDGSRRATRAPSLEKLRSLNLIHKEVFDSGFQTFFFQTYPDDANSILKGADQAERLQFDLLGSRLVDLKAFRARRDLRYSNGSGAFFEPATVASRVPWHFDFKAGVGWRPDLFFTDVRYGPGADIKVPWELSRCQHFVTLGQAYRLTGDEKYARAYFEQIEDWIRFNPPKFGVNWACPMDVGLRACNWLAGWEFFKESRSLSSFFKENFTRSLWEHGNHIYHHLEWNGEVSSNHYVSDLVGLAYIGLALNEPKWADLARQEMEKEIFNQTHDDGMDFEGSTAYHRLVLELFFYFSLVFTRSGALKDEGPLFERAFPVLSPAYLDRLKKMFGAALSLCSIDGRSPLIGDNDSGHAHIFFKRDDGDMRHLIQSGALFFNEPDLKMESWNLGSEPVWIFGTGAVNKFSEFKGVRNEAVPSLDPASSGFAVFRGKEDVLIFCAQPNGTRGMGNHTHNDKLSFTLTIKGDDFLIDPGTGLYTPDPSVRNLFRSTAMHNTVMAAGEEQNRISRESLFSLSDDARVEILNWNPNQTISALHTGYRRLEPPLTHKRSVKREPGAAVWEIIDELEGEGETPVQWHFIFDPAIKAEVLGSRHWRLHGRHGSLDFQVFAEMPLRDEIKEVPFSPAYGVINRTTALRIHGVKKNRLETIKLVLSWQSQ